jgi:hypothetical protein
MSRNKFDIPDFERQFEALQAEYTYRKASIQRIQAEHSSFEDEVFIPKNQSDYLKVLSLLNELKDFLGEIKGLSGLDALREQAQAMEQLLLPQETRQRQHFDIYMNKLNAGMMLNKYTETLDILAGDASQYIDDISKHPGQTGDALHMLERLMAQYEEVYTSLNTFFEDQKEVLPERAADKIKVYEETFREMQVSQASRGYVLELADLQECLNEVQESRRSPSSVSVFQDEDKAEEDKLRARCNALKTQLSVTAAQAITTAQKQTVASFQSKLEKITQQLEEEHAPDARRSPVNLPPKNATTVSPKNKWNAEHAQLHAELLESKRFAERVLKQAPWQEEARSELQKHLVDGRFMPYFYALRAQERAALARPKSHVAYQDAIRALGDFLPESGQQLGGNLRKKVARFLNAQQALAEEVPTLQTREAAVAHMQRLSSAVDEFFAEPLGDIIDWETGYRVALTALQSSEALVKASLAPVVEPDKLSHRVDDELEQCVKAHETMQQASKAYQAALGTRPARVMYEKACKDLGYVIQNIRRAQEKKSITLTAVQAETLEVLKEDLLREVDSFNPMLTEIEQEKCKRACEKLDVTAETLDVTLSEAHSVFDEEKNKTRASQQEKLAKLTGLIKQRAQGPGVGGFDLWRADEHRFFADARPMLQNILALEAQAQAVTAQYEKALATLKAEAERVGGEASKALGLPQQIKAYETRLKALETWSADSALDVYASALVDEALTADIDNAIATFFKSTQKMEMLASKQAFKQDLARLQHVMKAVHADSDVVVDAEDRQRFETMTRETFHGIEDTKQAMDVFLAEDDLTPVQRTAVQALHDEVCAMEAELGIPSQAALQAFDKHLNTAHTPQVALKNTIGHGIDGLKAARQKLKVAQDKNRNLFVKNAARVKTALSDTEFRHVREVEYGVLMEVNSIVQDVATREHELQTLIGQYARELHVLEEQPGASTKEIKQVKKNLKDFEAWNASSDFEQYRVLLNADKTAVDEADDAVNAFVALLKEKQEEFRKPQFKSDLVLLKQCMEKMAKNKDAILGEQEEIIYQNFVVAMEPLYGMKQELDALLTPTQDAAALTVAQQVALEGLRDDVLALDVELALPSERDLVALDMHHGNEATVGELFEGLDELEDTLALFEARARFFIKKVLDKPEGNVSKEHIQASRSDAKINIKSYKIYLSDFQDLLQKSHYRALRHEDAALDARLSRFEAVLLELESNAAEPWDLQWAATQMGLFAGGVMAFGAGGWQGCKDVLAQACAGFGYLRDIASAFGGPSDHVAVVQEDKTDYQKHTVPHLLSDIVTNGGAGLSYQHCAGEYREAKTVLLAMIPVPSMLPGMNLFGRKPEVVSDEKTLQAFERQKKRVDTLQLQLQHACTEALGKVDAALHNPNDDEQLSPTQKSQFESLEVDIKAAQAEGKFDASEKAKIMKYSHQLGGKPDGNVDESEHRHDL